jgi:hypothetical protein
VASLASCIRRGLAKAIACPTLVRGAWGDLFLKASLVDELGAAGRPAPDERKRQPPRLKAAERASSTFLMQVRCRRNCRVPPTSAI